MIFSDLEESVLEYIDGSSKMSFDRLACMIAEMQYKEVIAYRDFVDFSGTDPSEWINSSSITPVPSIAYEGNLFVHDEGTADQDALVFYSNNLNSKMVVGNSKTLDYSIWYSFKHFASDVPDICLSLIPDYHENNLSIMSYLFSQGFADRAIHKGYRVDGAEFFLDENLVDDFFELYADDPVTIYGTSEMLSKFASKCPIKLAEGSKIIEITGFEGIEDIPRQKMIEDLRLSFGVKKSDLINIHGNDLTLTPSWQFGDGPHVFPKWVRVRNEQGSMVITDLAQIWSVCALHTKDKVRIIDDISVVYEGTVKDSPALEKGLPL